jgi:hypothetical protein
MISGRANFSNPPSGVLIALGGIVVILGALIAQESRYQLMEALKQLLKVGGFAFLDATTSVTPLMAPWCNPLRFKK